MNTKNHYYQTCLKNELEKRCKRNPKYSLRSFALALEVSPGSLSKILNGKKVLTFELAEKILTRIDIDPKEQKNFWHSIQKSYEDSNRKRKDKKIVSKTKSLSKQKERDLTPEIFSVISDWYHYAILQLVKTENFVATPKWIAKELGISEMQAKLAVEKLLQLELLEEKNGVLRRTEEQLTTGDLALTNSALKRRIKQITEKSLDSLQNDPIEKRNHTTMTMGIDPDKLPLAKQMIQDFMDQLSEVLETKNKQVYELQINLFPLQKGE